MPSLKTEQAQTRLNSELASVSSFLNRSCRMLFFWVFRAFCVLRVVYVPVLPGFQRAFTAAIRAARVFFPHFLSGSLVLYVSLCAA